MLPRIALVLAGAMMALGCSSAPEPPPPAAAGFVDVPPQVAPADEHDARLFWEFRPADTDAESRPTFVVFNGGPGAATSSLLLAFGAGPMRVDFETGALVKNPASFTRLGNLLFIDERNAGLSYQTGTASCSYDRMADAADFIRTMVAVLTARPSLRGPIYVLAESYGGMRATAMLHLLFDPSGADAKTHRLDQVMLPWLRDRLGLGAVTPTGDQVRTLFRGLILIEPELFGKVQYDAQQAYLPSRPDLTQPDRHREDVRYTNAEFETHADFALNALATDDGFAALVGVSMTDVPSLAAPERGSAVRFRTTAATPGETLLNARLAERLGTVGATDAYYLALAPVCDTRPIFSDAVNAASIQQFGESLALPTFITRAKYDAAIVSDVIPIVMEQLLPPRTDGQPKVVFDGAPRAGEARPGWLRFARAGRDIEVRFPEYAAGHIVTATAGQELFDDVAAWMKP